MVALAACLGITLARAGLAHADEVYLSKGVIRGRIVERVDGTMTIETASGLLMVPQNAVSHVTTGPTPLERYEEERNKEPLSAQRHVELAQWCREAGLPGRALDHTRLALEADPASPPALRHAGYVSVGGVWMKANPPSRKARREEDAIIVTVVVALASGWQWRINSLAEDYIAALGAEGVADDVRRQLLAFDTPLAIPGACRALYGGDSRLHRLLVDVLGKSEEDMARLHLAIICVLDTDRRTAEAAAEKLADEGDPRSSLFLRRALGCESEAVIRRAAAALGIIGDRSAVGDLVEALSTDSRVGTRITPRALFAGLPELFNKPLVVPISDQPILLPTDIVFPDFNRRLEELAKRQDPGGRFRSEAQDALITITGENFGFDIDAWRDWVARNPSIDQVHP